MVSIIFDMIRGDLYTRGKLRHGEGVQMGLLQEMANREKRLWATLFVDVAVALYYFPKALALLLQGAGGLVPALVGLVFKSTVLGIVLALIMHFVFAVASVELAADEREQRFAARAKGAGYIALQVFAIALIWQISASALFPNADRLPDLANPFLMAHLLLLALIVSRLIKSGLELFFFRRGY